MATKPRPVIIGLDLLRFAAALLVMLYHFGAATWAAPKARAAEIAGAYVSFPELFHAAWSGWVGVEIFFVISGLVIAYSADGAGPYKFLNRRILRLYPAVWICSTITLLVLIVTHASIPHMAQRWLASMTLFPSGPYIDTVYWTLGIEMAFYALIFLLLATNLYDRLEIVSWLLGGISSAYWILGDVFAPDFLRDHVWNRLFELSLVPYGCFFAIGSMTYIASRRGVSWSRGAAILIFMAAGCVEILYMADYNNTIFKTHESALQPQAIFIFAMMFVFASMRVELKKAGVGHAFRLLGLTTYPLYLIHDFIGAEMMKYIVIAGGSRYMAFGAAMGACVIAAVLIAIWIEPAVQARMRPLLERLEAKGRK